MKNHKSFLAGMLTMLLITCLFGSASATRGVFQKEIEYQDIKISLDGVALDLRDAQGNVVEPFKFGGTNYVPARALAEALGLTVAWDGANSTVVLAHPAERRPIYITASGEHYHYNSTCNGGTYWEAPLSSALGMNLTPCDKCVLTNSNTQPSIANPAPSGTGNENNFYTWNNTEQQQTTAQHILNTKSLKIHYPSCREVPKIAPQNYLESNESIDALFQNGYTYCGVCHK